MKIFRQYKRADPTIAHKDIMTLSVNIKNFTGIRAAIGLETEPRQIARLHVACLELDH